MTIQCFLFRAYPVEQLVNIKGTVSTADVYCQDEGKKTQTIFSTFLSKSNDLRRSQKK